MSFTSSVSTQLIYTALVIAVLSHTCGAGGERRTQRTSLRGPGCASRLPSGGLCLRRLRTQSTCRTFGTSTSSSTKAGGALLAGEGVGQASVLPWLQHHLGPRDKSLLRGLILLPISTAGLKHLCDFGAVVQLFREVSQKCWFKESL